MAANNQTYTTTVIINDSQAKKKIADYENEISRLRKEMDKAYSAGDKALGDQFARKMKATTKEMNRLKLETMDVDKVLDNLSDASINQLQKAAKSLNAQMKNLSASSEEFKRTADKLREVNTALAQARSESRAAESWSTRLANGFNKWQGAIIGAAGAITGLTMTIRKAVQSYADMEEAMADVRKYTGMTDEQVRDLNEDLKKMDTRTSRAELNSLAGDAGRLGIQGKEAIEEFVDAADKIHVALGDDLGDSAVRDIGKLSQTFGDSERMGLRGAMLATGSAVNELAQSSSAAAGYIVDFTAKIAGSANQAGIAQTNVMGYASVLDQNMQQMETSSTALSQLITKMYQDPQKFARLAGEDVKKFTDLLRNDANEALLKFLESMQARGGFDSLAPMFSEMGLSGTRAVGVLSTLATNIQEVRRQQQIANEAFKAGTSVIDEFGVQNTTVQAEIDKAKKQFLEVAVALGQQLNPIVKYTITSTSLMVKGLSALINILVNCRVTIIAATVALIAWNAAAIKALVVEKVTTALKACKTAFLALSAAIKANPWVLLATTVATVIAGIVEYTTRTKEATKATGELEAAARKQKQEQESISRKTAELTSRYGALQSQWKSLSKEQEKIAWIKRNQEAFSALGVTVNTVNEAENYLVKNASKVTASLKMIAEATVYQEKLQQAVRSKADWESKTNGRVKFRSAAGQLYGNLSDEEKQGLKSSGIQRGGGSRLSEQEVSYVNNMRLKATRATYEKSRKMFDDEIEHAAQKLTEVSSKIDSTLGTKFTPPSGGSDTTEKDKGKTEDPNKVAERQLQETFAKQSLLRKEYLAMDLKDANLTNEEKAQAQRDYDEDMYQMRQSLYAKLRDIYAKDSKDWVAWEDKRMSEQLSHDGKIAAEAQKRLEERLAEEQKSKEKASEETRRIIDRNTMRSEEDELARLRIKLEQEKTIIEDFHAQGLIQEEEYQKALEAIQNAHAELQKKARKKSISDTASAVEFALGQVSSIVSGISSYVKAEYDLQTAKVTARYDAEIEAAKAAGKDTTALEEKKQKELNKIKLEQIDAEAEANKAQALINIALGVTKAIAEYVWPYNLVVAGITTAMGMVELATIEKQAQAQRAAIGYYSGGFTGGNNYRREAGVVHEGEFVANHETVNNPAFAPLLDLINTAQQNNTSGSLTMSDISRQIGATPAAAPVVNITTDNSDIKKELDGVSATMSRLSKQLDEGIEAEVVMTKFKKTEKEYNNLMSNR